MVLINKRLILAAVLPFSFWIGVFVFWFYGASPSSAEPIVIKSQNKNLSGPNISQLASANAQIDTDGDGLSDWEENIYGTDPKKSDTDGDNYLDGEEILSNHDPLKKGPDDLIPAEPKEDTAENSGKSAAEKLSELAVANYMKAFPDDDPTNLDESQLNQVLIDSFNSPEMSKEFSAILKSELYFFIMPNLDKELNISQDDSGKSQNKYWLELDKFITAFVKEAPPYNLLQSIDESMKEKNHSKITEIAGYYKSRYESAKKISVPSSLLNRHRIFLAEIYKSWKIAEAIKTMEKNPARALLALNELAKLLQSQSENK